MPRRAVAGPLPSLSLRLRRPRLPAICGDRGWAAYAFEVEVATSPPDVWGGCCWIAAAFGVGSATGWNALFDCGSQPAKLAQLRAMTAVAKTPARAGLPTKIPHASTKKCLHFAIYRVCPRKGTTWAVPGERSSKVAARRILTRFSACSTLRKAFWQNEPNSFGAARSLSVPFPATSEGNNRQSCQADEVSPLR